MWDKNIYNIISLLILLKFLIPIIYLFILRFLDFQNVNASQFYSFINISLVLNYLVQFNVDVINDSIEDLNLLFFFRNLMY